MNALATLTDSELRTWRACPRKHDFQYVQLRRSRADHTALSFGTLWHTGQEAWWKWAHDAQEVRLAAAVEAMRASPDADSIALVIAEELMLGYTAMWGDVEWRVLAIEQRFEMPLVNPETGAASRTYVLGGKVDGIVANDNGVVVLEHKTTASDIEPGSLYWKKVRTLDTQVSQYVRGARALGHDPRACLYDVVRKPAIRPLKATPVESRKYTKQGFLYANQREHDETPEEFRARLRADIEEKPSRYYCREEIVRLDSDERDHQYDVWSQARMMREARLAGFAPKNPDACSAFGGCPYFQVCAGEASIDDDTLFRTATSAHEELESE